MSIIDLITTLYADDGFRVTLWHALTLTGLDDTARHIITTLGLTLWEDLSISKEA